MSGTATSYARTLVRRGIAITSAALLTLAGAACSEPSAVLPNNPDDAPLLENGNVFRMDIEPGLEQVVSIENDRVHQGDILRLRSVVRNTSNAAKKIEALICQLEVRTNMSWDPYDPLILCFAYSMNTELAPQDSLVLHAEGRVRSGPGRYTMVVRHLLRPDIRARVRVNVHAALTPAANAK